MGYRSFGPKRGLLYGGADYVEHANETMLTIVQIETAQGLANVDAIAAVPGLDMLYVGPVRPGPGAGPRAAAPEPDRSGGDGGGRTRFWPPRTAWPG